MTNHLPEPIFPLSQKLIVRQTTQPGKGSKKVKAPAIGFLLCLIIACCLPASAAYAGQVITEDIKLWAANALKQEKSLDTISGKNTVAVLYFRNTTGRPEIDPLQKGMTLMVITDLSGVKGLQVIERTKLQALVDELGLGSSGLVSSESAPRVGRLLGARWITGGGIAAGPSELISVRSDVLDASVSAILGQPTAEGRLSEIFLIEKNILFGIIGLLKIDVSAEDEKKLRKPCTANYDAFLHLIRGVDNSDKGAYEKAAEAYEKALKEDPSICIAGGALDELKALGLVGGRSKTTDLLWSLRDGTSLSNQLGPKDQTRFKPAEAGTPASVDVTFPKTK